MATITKTPAGTWKAIIRKSGWPSTTKTFRTKTDAKDWARSTEDAIVRGLHIDRAPAEKITLEKAVDRYLQEVTPSKKPSTQVAEQRKAKQIVNRLGKYALAAITSDLVAQYRDKRLEEGKSATTIRLELAFLSHLFTIAIKEWRLGLIYNPVTNIRKPSESNGRNRRLNKEEEDKLLRECEQYSNPMLKWVVSLALATGMRAGELLTLTKEQVDLSRRVVRLSNTKNGSERTIPLSRNAINIFKEAFAEPIRPINTDLIFWGNANDANGNRKPYDYKNGWGIILKKAGIENLRFHDLRHEAISRLVEAGLGDQEVAAISGHKSMQMLKRYTHLRAEDLVARLDQLNV